jgi:hypothetical protein
MNKDLVYNSECLTSFLCDDIIELCKFSENELSIKKEFIIPKNNEDWKNIEKILYKELLTHIMHYKNNLILLNTNNGNLFIEQLSKKIYTKDFKITIKKSSNRFNIISYFFCLYETVIINNIEYNDIKGKIFLFPEEYKVNNIGIYGQLCFENVV